MDVESVCQVLDRAHELVVEMYACHEDDRIAVYRRLDRQMLDLEGRLKMSPNRHSSSRIEELKFHLLSLAHIYEPDEYPDIYHYEKALGILTELRGPLCFGA